MKDPYYDRPELSNSDLSWLQGQLGTPTFRGDVKKAYRFGTLIDCMITEKHKINYFNRTCAGEIYSADEFKLAEEMKLSFYKDAQCRWMADNAIFQKIDIREIDVNYLDMNWKQWFRIKWDLGLPAQFPSGDIKSTTATTQRQFEEAAHYFQYFRQRAVYMDVGQTDRDLLIGISKKNLKIFKIPITRDSELYNIGKSQYSELAFKYNYLFNNFKKRSMIKIKKAALSGVRGLKVAYSYREADGSTTDITRDCGAPVHEDLMDVFRKFDPHLAIISEYVIPGKKFNIENPDHDLLPQFKVNQIEIDDDTTGVKISGTFILSTDKRISLSMPSIKFADKDPYAYVGNLAEITEMVKREIEAYLNGKHAPEAQIGIDFPEEEIIE